ncbi:MAG: MarR family winged helix-turn-helix transcriptional regulator [Bacteroidota bacterium]
MPANKPTAGPNFARINPSTCANARLRRLHRMLNQAYMQAYKPFGLRGSMVSILFIIGKKAPVNQKHLADILILDPSTMSRDLKKLEKEGYVLIQKGADPRQSELFLTQKGFELLEEVSPLWESLHKQVEAILGQFQLQQIDMITEAIRANLPLKP